MIAAAGIGFRRDLADLIIDSKGHTPFGFVELAPENWMQVGGKWGRKLRRLAELYPITCHGLSLSIGSPEELDYEFLKNIKKFLSDFSVKIFSEHLSYCKCDNAHLYELLPLPFTADAVRHVALRISQVQDFLERKICIENVSYYTAVAPEMSELEFLKAILTEADCNLLLDVNNVYVNAFNHGYNARDFIAALPLERVGYIHMAGHEQRTPDLIIDTHGEAIVDPVFDLFAWTIKKMQPVPVLLERDFNFPEFEALLDEGRRLVSIMDAAWCIGAQMHAA